MIQIQNVSKNYTDTTGVKGISFNLKKNEPLAILGRNGAGKTTILKILIGLLKADSGRVIIPNKIKIGYLPEDRGMYPDSTVLENLILFSKLSGSSNFYEESLEILRRFGLTNYKDIKVKHLSKGNKQKLQLSAVFINSPELIILDEPLSGLDPVNKELLSKIISEKKQSTYIIISSHQMDFIEKICSSVIFLKEGNILEAGTIDQMKSKYGIEKIIIPMPQNIDSFLKEISYKQENIRIKENSLELIIKKENMKSLAEIINQILTYNPNISFLRYDKTTLDNIYIDLLSKEDE